MNLAKTRGEKHDRTSKTSIWDEQDWVEKKKKKGKDRDQEFQEAKSSTGEEKVGPKQTRRRSQKGSIGTRNREEEKHKIKGPENASDGWQRGGDCQGGEVRESRGYKGAKQKGGYTSKADSDTQEEGKRQEV